MDEISHFCLSVSLIGVLVINSRSRSWCSNVTRKYSKMVQRMSHDNSEIPLEFSPDANQLGCHVGSPPGACSRELVHHSQPHVHGQIS